MVCFRTKISDFVTKTRAALLKHRKNSHEISSSSLTLTLPQHQSTQNNMITEMLPEVLTDGEVVDTPESSEPFKFTCLDCNISTKSKANLNKHVKDCHAKVQETVCFVCAICGHRFNQAEELNVHVCNHGDISP